MVNEAVIGDQALCQSIRTLMKETGVVVDTAHSIQEVLTLLQTGTADILLVDWTLLHLAGFPAAQALRVVIRQEQEGGRTWQ